MSTPVTRVDGRPLPLPGNDIDTDRIIPARFARSLTFDGLGAHVLADDRAEMAAAGTVHPFDDPRYAGASVLVVNKNFGCGSSREHAVHALTRAGVRAVVGESFSNIFLGNCVTNGVPAVTADEQAVRALMDEATRRPDRTLAVDLERMVVSAPGSPDVPIHLPDGVRDQFLTGRWDPLAELLEARDEILALAARLPAPRHEGSDR